MKVLNLFKGRVLESILIIAAIAVAIAAFTVVSNLLALNARLEQSNRESLYSRQLILKPTAEDYSAFYLSSIPADVREVGPKESTLPKLALTDLAEVKAAAPSLALAYVEDYWEFSHEALDSSELLSVSKVTADFQEAAELNVSEGSLLSPTDFDKHNRVMLISPLGVKKLKLEMPLVGQRINFESDGSYTIVGVLKQTDAQDEDDYYEAFVPWEPSEWSGIQQLTLSTKAAADVPEAQSEVRAYADKTWKGAMVVRSNAESSRVYFEGQRIRTLIMAVFASLGLVTAALSIMSLMLARVLRRQREIGVRRSLGATRRAIRNLFLGEALALGAFGGVLGVAAGYGLHVGYRRYMKGLEEVYSDLLTFSIPAALTAFGVALLVSLLFGLYPASRASKVRIVDILTEA